MSHRWFVSRQLGFALRCLDPREQRAFARHTRSCPECVRAVEVLEQELSWLGMAVRPTTASPGFGDRVRAWVIGRN
jgi:hypothetical protein